MLSIKTLFSDNTLSRKECHILFIPYSLMFCVNKGIREKVAYVSFLLRELIKNQGLRQHHFLIFLSPLGRGCTSSLISRQVEPAIILLTRYNLVRTGCR